MQSRLVKKIIDWICLEGRRVYNNSAYSRLFGNIENKKGTDSFAEIHPDDRKHIMQVFKETVRSGTGLTTDFRFVLPDGSIRHMESRGGLVKNSQGQPSRVIVVSRDITERKLAEQKIHNLAFYDLLTRLPNRRLLNDRLSQTITASKRSARFAALMFIDLDNFKPLNDGHGHAAGDLLLQEVARRISGCVREAVALNQASPTGVTVRGAYVYWASAGDGTVSRRLRDQQADGGAAGEVVATGLDHPNLVVADTDGVYFAEFSPTGSVWKLGDDLLATAFTQPMDTPAGLVVRPGDVCVTTYNAAGLVQCNDKVTHEASLTVAIGQDHPAELASDGTALYWANNIAKGQIMRWRSGDVKPRAIAVDLPFPNGIVVAGKWVYWTNNVLGGTVMRALKD